MREQSLLFAKARVSLSAYYGSIARVLKGRTHQTNLGSNWSGKGRHQLRCAISLESGRQTEKSKWVASDYAVVAVQ